MIRAFYGGSFDPFHKGHLAIVRRLLDDGLVDRVHVVPAAQAPGKSEPRASAVHRLEMVRRGLPDDGLRDGTVLLEDLEHGREGPSYTVDSLTVLRGRHRGDDWRLVMGADALADMESWRDPQRLLAMARPLVFTRETEPRTPPGVDPLWISDFACPISSSAIRRDLAAGGDVEDRLPPPVLAYIRENDLYRQDG